MPDTLTPESPPAASVPSRSAPSLTRTFGITIFLSAFLLFQVQLIIAKYILPMFGGAPAVWTTSMLCFQVLLLLGYAYAHVLSSHSPPRAQGRRHATLLLASLIVLLALWIKWGTPLTPGPGWKPQPGDNPAWRILELLSVTVGLPFFILSSTGPLLQRWLSRGPSGSRAYRFYGLSNAGSLLGLVTYPFLFEWALTIKHQAWLWSLGYVAFVLLGTWIALHRPEGGADHLESPTPAHAAEQISPRQWPLRQLLWVGLSCVSSIMLLATTNLLCQDVAVIPLLWVLPLAIYLFSFILTFESTRWYSRRIFWPLYFLFLGLALKISFDQSNTRVFLRIAIYSAALLAVCMVCHGELARSKPAANHLTRFYLFIALGGAVGGAFVVVLAPLLFRGFWEFQIALVGCGVFLFAAFFLEDAAGQAETPSWEYALAILIAFLVPHLSGLLPKLSGIPVLSREAYTLAAAAVVLLLREVFRARARQAARQPSPRALPWRPVAVMALLGLFAILAYAHTQFGSWYTLDKERNFFGVKYVEDSLDGFDLRSGSTVHGVEIKDPAKRSTPTLYYRPSSGAGLLISNFPRGAAGHENVRVGLIGLGVGTLAAYGQPGDSYRFYEIDPQVIQIAAGSRPFFHFIADSHATIQIVPGDARLSLEREPAQDFDVLVVDAFSGDAIPLHLLTREAMQIYLRHMRFPGGVLAFHISNIYLDLAPVVQGLANSFHLSSTEVYDKTSRWILLSQDPAMLRLPNLAARATPVVLHRRPLLWTDDYSNLFQVLKRPGK